jgi:predicted amidohydrolase YtcJ
MTEKADLLLRSDCIFTGIKGHKLLAGHVAVKEDRLLSVASTDGTEYLGSSSRVYDLGKRLICPGFIDVHCFFTGHAWEPAGGDPAGASSDTELLEKARNYLKDRQLILPIYKEYMGMMNSRGITAVKEMAFDDFCGFTGILEELESSGELRLRTHFMSQPVGAPMDPELGCKLRDKYHSPFFCFSGFNRMTDGSISRFRGDLKEPYVGKPGNYGEEQIDYGLIEKETLAADQEGFRFSLHAQGDRAVSRVLDIYEKCRRQNGRLVNRHAITDLELTDPVDFVRMGSLGAIAEIYPQIPSLYTRQDKLDTIKETIGMERGRRYWDRRGMANNGVVISCGTDLPLLYDDIPESIYHATGAFFSDGGEPFNSENALTIEEILNAWTFGGAWNLGMEKSIGTLEPGKLADIAVLDGNVFETPMEIIKRIKVCLTLVNGKVVYATL